VFVGPAPETLEAAGDKLAAREHAVAAGLPVLPGGRVLLDAGGSTQVPRALAPGISRNGPARTAGSDATAAGVDRGSTEADAKSDAAGPGEAASPAEVAGRVGYPVLVKAAGGGGGRGLRVVRDPAELGHAVAVASAEAEAAFGDPRVYLERYVERGRHVEVQLLGDGEHVIHLGDRDCSVQRRYQKLIEEAPAPGLDDGLRERLRAAAVALGERLRYRGAGTVEFLVDAGSAHASGGEFYFLEVNARVQVEHPVTEAVTGIDIVAEQLALAEGRPLRLKQADVTLAGHAIEVRLNAEDPASDFRPSPGTVTRAVFPATTFSAGFPATTGSAGAPSPAPAPPGSEAADGHAPYADADADADEHRTPGADAADGRTGAGDAGDVRVDTHLQAGATVPPYYDSLLAKVIARGTDRARALVTLRAALDRCVIDGVTTNLELHRALLADPEFAAGGVDTGYLARWLARGPRAPASAGPAPGGHGAGAEQAAPVRDRLDLDPGASDLGSGTNG
jgi:acetyl/propionyl-CoA carboxylase alpha subunit